MQSVVYRVEHVEHGNGPYIRKDRGINWCIRGLHDAHQASSDHPGPKQDGLWMALNEYKHVFGFPTREAADWWFKNFKHKLKAEGFVVNVYESEYVRVSDSGKQCIFEKNPERLIDTQSVIGYSKYYQTN